MARTLKAFAEWYVGDGEHLRIRFPGEGTLRVGPHSTEFVLYREPPFQVTLVTLFPGYVVPPHAHKYVSSYDLSLSGDGHALVGGHTWTKKIQDKPRLDLRIPVLAGIVHSGHTDIGAIFLSIQKWSDGEPRFLSEDWVADKAFKDVP